MDNNNVNEPENAAGAIANSILRTNIEHLSGNNTHLNSLFNKLIHYSANFFESKLKWMNICYYGVDFGSEEEYNKYITENVQAFQLEFLKIDILRPSYFGMFNEIISFPKVNMKTKHNC